MSRIVCWELQRILNCEAQIISSHVTKFSGVIRTRIGLGWGLYFVILYVGFQKSHCFHSRIVTYIKKLEIGNTTNKHQCSAIDVYISK